VDSVAPSAAVSEAGGPRSIGTALVDPARVAEMIAEMRRGRLLLACLDARPEARPAAQRVHRRPYLPGLTVAEYGRCRPGG
jgi:hypothetical protein